MGQYYYREWQKGFSRDISTSRVQSDLITEAYEHIKLEVERILHKRATSSEH